jgi:NTP pyrophosphatase (non-canonical NTP hydrolase)
MKANDYQKWTETTVVYKGSIPLQYYTLGLVGEAGEFADKVKKIMRDGLPTPEIVKIQKDLLQELGDTLWYLARLSDFLGMTLEQLMDLNRVKLIDRQQRDMLHGKGDNR